MKNINFRKKENNLVEKEEKIIIKPGENYFIRVLTNFDYIDENYNVNGYFHPVPTEEHDFIELEMKFTGHSNKTGDGRDFVIFEIVDKRMISLIDGIDDSNHYESVKSLGDYFRGMGKWQFIKKGQEVKYQDEIIIYTGVHYRDIVRYLVFNDSNGEELKLSQETIYKEVEFIDEY